MILLTNKLCELIPFDEKHINDIQIKYRINDLAYAVSLDKHTKYKKINFRNDRNSENEYPILIIVDRKFRRLLFAGATKYLQYRNTLVGATVCFDGKYPLKKSMLLAQCKVFVANIKLYLKKLWHAGVLGRNIIADDKIYVETHLPDFYNNYFILNGINETYDKVKRLEKEVKAKTKKAQAIEFLNLVHKI